MSQRPWTLGVCFRGVVLVGLVLPAPTGFAQITVEGLEHQEVYGDRATFRVVEEPGFAYAALLNDVPASTGVTVEVDRPDYHELLVTRQPDGGGAEESLLIQFIVRDTARGNSEWGLPPWTPVAPVPSAAEEFAGADLVLVVPSAYPTGLEIPVIALVEEGLGERVGVNGTVKSGAFPGWSLNLLRGVGSSFLPAFAAPDSVELIATVASLSTSRPISVEASTTWTSVSGTLASSVDWGEDARVHVIDDLTVGPGVTLAVGAGSVIRVAPGVEITVKEKMEVTGTRDRPVVFTAEQRTTPWGGIICDDSDSRLDMAGAILTGSGADDDWFDNNSGRGGSHRDEQPLIYLSDGARATLTDCYLVDNEGQAGHGEDSYLTMTRCLVQRCVTTGQYNGGAITLNQCALLEFPAVDAPFEDDDSDAFYLTGGAHTLTECLIGWALDDGVDAGSGSDGAVTVDRCWIEACFHEALAWSRGRDVTCIDTVTINCGQGIECGHGEPDVLAERCLSTANAIGARFGDNYAWDFEGFLEVRDSLLLYNYRDVWGRAWDNWEVHLSRMNVHDNFLTAAEPDFPDNSVWDPTVDAPRLQPYLPTAPGKVGVGLAVSPAGWGQTGDANLVPVGLSTFTTHQVTVAYAVETDAGIQEEGSLTFLAGETIRYINLESIDLTGGTFVKVSISNPGGADLTGKTEVSRVFPRTLVAKGSEWRYLDGGVVPEAGWMEPGYDDSSWSAGPGQLGFGDDDESTVIDGGPSDARYPAVYFRHSFSVEEPERIAKLFLQLLRDDGAVVYLNGHEVHRSNMPTGSIEHSTEALSSNIDEDAYQLVELSPLLPGGTNVLAVEVHQANATSSDLSFDLELFAEPSLVSATSFVRGDANEDRSVDLSDAVRTLLVLFQGASAPACLDALDSDDSGVLDLTDVIYELEFLFIGGAPIPPPYPGLGEDPTEDSIDC